MRTISIYYSAIYYIFLAVIMLLIPVATCLLLFFYQPGTDYQLSYESSYLTGFFWFCLCGILSRVLFALRKERQPRKWNQWLIVIGLSGSIIYPAYIAIAASVYNWITFLDDIPVQKEGRITEIVPNPISSFGPIDNIRYGQIPSTAYGKPNRYGIRLTIDSDDKPFYTSLYFYQISYQQTLSQLGKAGSRPIVITYLPTSRHIVRIDLKNDTARIPLYENNFFNTNRRP